MTTNQHTLKETGVPIMTLGEISRLLQIDYEEQGDNLVRLVFKYADMDLRVFLGEYATKASDQKFTKDAEPLSQHLKLLLDFIESSLAAHMFDVGCISAEMPEMVNQKPFFEGKGANINNIFNLLGTPAKENWPGVTQLHEQISDYDKISAKDDEPDNSMLEAPANNGPPSDAEEKEDEEEHKEENRELDDIDEDPEDASDGPPGMNGLKTLFQSTVLRLDFENSFRVSEGSI